jgi:O-antigen ligase
MRVLSGSINWKIASLCLAAIAALVAVFASGGQLNPKIAAVACIGIPVGLVVICKYPPLLIAGLLYVGSFKDQAAAGFSLTDPTLILTGMLAAAIGLDLLLTFSGVRDGTISERFAGQGLGVGLFLVFFALLAISYLYSPSPIAGWEKLTKFAVFETLGFFAPFLLFKCDRDFRTFLWATVIVAACLSVRMVAGMVHPTSQELLGEADLTRIGEGHTIGTALLILLFYRFPGTFSRALPLILVPLLAVGLVASEARGPAFSLIIVLLLCTTVVRVQAVVPRKTIFAGILLIAVVSVVSLIWLSNMPGYAVRGLQKKAEIQSMLHGSLAAGGTTALRATYFQSAVHAFMKKPLQGWGLNGWTMYHFGEDRIYYPHNFILEVAAEQGVPGVTVLVGLLLTCFFGLLRVAKTGYREFILVLPILLFTVFYNSTTGEIENRSLFFWLGTALVTARMAKQWQERERAANVVPQNFELVPAESHGSATNWFSPSGEIRESKAGVIRSGSDWNVNLDE